MKAKKVIEVSLRASGRWEAKFEGRASWEQGATREEAVGALVLRNKEEFGLVIDDLPEE